MAYTPSPECRAAAVAASGGKLTDDEITAAFERIDAYKRRLQASGDIDGMAERLKGFAEREAERTQVAAALQKRHAALNVLARDRLNQTMDSLTKSGLKPDKALLAIMEGTQRGVEGGRDSVGALTLAYEARYAGGMMADLSREVPAFQRLTRDPQFDADVAREMAQIREDGQPGITGNADAQKVARIFARYAEMARTDLNRLGASIGKLDGWSGAQTHDDVKMIQSGKDAWVAYTATKLDLARTFPDADPDLDVKEVLGDVYDTIITGVPNEPTAREKGQRVNPANLAKSLGKTRVLHFRDADAALDYRETFGYGTTVSGIAAHLRRSAQLAAAMERFGPNPEVMFGSLIEAQKRKIKESTTLSDVEKTKRIAKLNADGGSLKAALDGMTGLATRPVNVTGAKVSSDIRAVVSMAKLGGAVLTSIPSDTVTNAIASQFRGSGFFKGLVSQLEGVLRGRPKGEQAEISFLLGEGFDGIVGHMVAPAAAQDGPVGKLARSQDAFFRLSGLTGWTDASRATAARTIAAEMGMRAKTAFDALPANYRHVLGLHNIDAAKWDAIRTAGVRADNGRDYITPDLMRNLPDAAVEPLVKARIDAARKATRIDEAKGAETIAKREAEFQERRAKILDDGRRELELSVGSFVADEVNYGVIETDAQSRRFASWNGTRPGTIAGEAARFIMQFKGFPVAFTGRVVGRAVRGQRPDASMIEKGTHIGTIIASLGVAGYMAMIMKDVAKGYWPPRDPSDPKTWMAALQQGGAMGIYGDYLFGEVNRFGGGLTETLIGPSIGSIGDLANLAMKARDAGIDPKKDAKAADFLNFALNNTPYINLFYTRPALDFLVLNSMREAATPGYLKRQATRRRKDYGQERIAPTTAFRF